MGIKFSNNASTTLASGITSGATSLTVATGAGAQFPSLGAGDYFYATIEEGASREIIRVTARSSDTFTITRAQEGTTAAAFTTAATVELRLTAAAIGSLTSDEIAEGTTRLYYTDARARAAISGTGSGGSYNPTTGVITFSGGGGGLTNFTEGVNTTSPNATVPVVTLTATNAATNVDAALIPKGTGALLGQIPDNAVNGGNKRGTNAVDWQRVRFTSAQVASGTSATIGGGERNEASGSYATAAGGYNNSVSGNYGFSVGNGNIVSASAATAPGGELNTASAQYASALGGYGNVANSRYGVAIGGFASTRSVEGAFAHAIGPTFTAGVMQSVEYLLYRQTTDATQTEMSADGGAPGSTTRITLPNNVTARFTVQLTARDSTGVTACWDVSGVIKRGASAAATAILGTLSTTLVARDAGAASWSQVIDADTTNGSLRVRVTGAAATTIRWFAAVRTTELVH